MGVFGYLVSFALLLALSVALKALTAKIFSAGGLLIGVAFCAAGTAAAIAVAHWMDPPPRRSDTGSMEPKDPSKLIDLAAHHRSDAPLDR